MLVPSAPLPPPPLSLPSPCLSSFPLQSHSLVVCPWLSSILETLHFLFLFLFDIFFFFLFFPSPSFLSLWFFFLPFLFDYYFFDVCPLHHPPHFRFIESTAFWYKLGGAAVNLIFLLWASAQISQFPWESEREKRDDWKGKGTIAHRLN